MINIFVGNLAADATENDLRPLFEPYGAIERISIVTDPETGRPRGFAFVEMVDDIEGQRAIRELAGANLHGQTLNIFEARPKPDWWRARLSRL